MGDTVALLQHDCFRPKPRDGVDFLPLAGCLPGKILRRWQDLRQPFFRKRGRPVMTVLPARVIDRGLRPMFPEVPQ